MIDKEICGKGHFVKCFVETLVNFQLLCGELFFDQVFKEIQGMHYSYSRSVTCLTNFFCYSFEK